MKVKVEDLTNEQLDELVARAQGWETACAKNIGTGQSSPEYWMNSEHQIHAYATDYIPTANPAQWAELIEAFSVHVLPVNGGWYAECEKTHADAYGNSPAIAICRAVVASVYGGEVEVNCD